MANTDPTQLPKATKRNSLTIEGQLWHFKRKAYWSPDTAGGSMDACYLATRYADGRNVTGSSTKENLVTVIADRILNGIY